MTICQVQCSTWCFMIVTCFSDPEDQVLLQQHFNDVFQQPLLFPRELLREMLPPQP